MLRFRTFLTAAVVAAAAAALYLPDLAGSPFYLNRDEMFFGLTAHSLATTGFDTNGHYLPLYTQSPMRYGSEMWFQPALMYSAALMVKLFGLSEATIRLPMALFAIVDIVLMYLVGRQLFKRELPALGAAALLAATPAHYINARVAMDFQAPLPFLLAWLLFTLTYLNDGRRRWLVAAGASLGIGLFTYIAAYMWMPVYVCLTLMALALRREPVKRSAIFVTAFLVPALSCVPFLILHPTVIRDVMWHYDRQQPQTAGGSELLVRYFDLQQFMRAAVVYRQFWSPRFLFVDGPGGLWAAGAFLFPTAGLLVAGVIATLRRTSVEAVLLFGGLLTAMVPASLVGDVDAIHRASAVLPFGILIAVAGIEQLRSSRTRVSLAIFGAIWIVLTVLAMTYHDQLPLAQAAIRACTVPLAGAGFALLLLKQPDAGASAALWIAAVVAILVLQPAYIVLGFPLAAWMSAGVLVGAWLAIPRVTLDTWIGAAVGAAAAHFVFTHADYSAFTRVGPIPATAVIMIARSIFAVAAGAGFVGVMRIVSRVKPASTTTTLTAVVLATSLLQLLYFRIDYFQWPTARTLHAVLVFSACAAAAVLVTRAGSATRILHWTAGAAITGLVAIQFGYFYADFFTVYRAHSGHFDTEGNQRVAWEEVLAIASRKDVPAIYFGSVGPYGFADLYWQFYAIKRHREDLLARSTGDLQLQPDRIATLPAGSVIVTSPSPDIDAAIQRLRDAHILTDARLLTAPDKRSTFWLLQTGPPS